MDRPPSASDPPAGAPPKEAPDRTQTIQSRGSSRDRTPDPGDAGSAATELGKGTPTWTETAGAGVSALPIDDPDRYALVGEHARGGLGRVVRATDTRLGRTVAVKELLKKSGTAEALFVREALITARLQHPGIIPVIEAGRWPSGEPYYVMKLVEGRSLKELIADRRTLAARLALLPNVIAVAEAIGYAHSQEVIHRDVKPANVVVGEFGETVVVDWGLARDGRRDAPADDLTDAELARVPRSGPPGAGSAETVSGRVIGTPQYMAPEQARGEAVDARADVYAIGALLYEVLAGIAPFAGGDADAILDKVVAGPPRPLAELASDAPPDLLAIVAKAMARAPADRYPTGKELAEDLKRFQTGQLVTAHQYGTVQLARRWIARHRGPVAVAAVGALICVLVAVGMIRRIVEERNLAQRERANAERAGRAADQRANALRKLQAESSVRRDPTAAVAWLEQLEVDDAMAGPATAVLEEALAAGVARHVFREDDWVFGVAFSPDGRHLSTASKDGRVRLYDLTASPPRSSMLGVHPGGVMSAAFVDGGKGLVTGGLDGSVLVWPTAGGAPRELGAVSGQLAHMRVSDAGVVQVWSEDDDFAMWQLPAGDLIVQVRNAEALVGTTVADVSPVDANQWVIGDAHGTISRLVKGEPAGELARLPRPPRALRIAPDGARAAVYDGAQLHVVELAPPRLRTIGELTGPLRHLVWSPDGADVAVFGETTDLYLFDAAAATSAHPRILRGHIDSIYQAHYTRDGKRILTASDDGTARVWDLVTGGVEVLRGHEDDVYQAAWSPDETMVATASFDGTARVWPVGASGVRVLGGDVGTIAWIEMLDEHTAMTISTPLQVIRWDLRSGDRAVVVPAVDDVHKVTMPAISRRGDVAYAPALASPDVQLVRADGTRALLRGHTDKVSGAGFSMDGSRLYSSSWDGTVRRWDVATGEGEVILEGDPIHMMLMAPDGERFLVGYDGRYALHDAGGARLHELRDAGLAASTMWGRKRFSPDGKSLVIAGKDGRAVHWVPETGAVIRLEGIGHHATNVAFSPHGDFLAGAMQDRTVRIWDLRTGKLTGTLEGHVDLVMNLAYSPDGAHLASTSYDRTVRVWDVHTGQSRVLRGHSGAVETLAWLGNGRQLLTGGRDGTLRIWPTPSTATPSPDALRRMIDRATTAEIGPGERLATPVAR